MELWEKTILPFLTGTAFEMFGFNILWWYVIVAAAAAVVILLTVTIAVACSKKKKKKKEKEANKAQDEETGESIHKKKNKSQVQPFSEIAPDWQPVAVAPKMTKKEQKQAAKLEKQQAKKDANANEEIVSEEPIETVAEEQIVEQPIVEEPITPPVEEEIITKEAVEETPIQEEPIEETPIQEQVEEEIFEPIEETVEEPIVPAESVAPAEPIVPAEPIKPIAERVVAEQKEDIEVAEKIKPASNSFIVYQPKPAAEPVKKVVVQKQQPISKPVQQPAKPVQKTVVRPVQQPVVQPQQVEENKVEEPAIRYETPIVRPQRVVPTVVEDDTNEQEVVATTAPRTLPKKTSKATKKTANQIADEIQAKTGTNPRKKADTPAVIGKDKLPKKSAKTKKADTAPTKATEVASDELPLITTDPNVESFGKFVIIKNDDNSARPYHYRLLANNGQILFESESYKSKPKSNSITAFKKAAVEENFEIDVDKAGNWRYKLYNSAHTVIGVGESYSTKQGCENSVQSVIKFAESARYLEDQTEN